MDAHWITFTPPADLLPFTEFTPQFALPFFNYVVTHTTRVCLFYATPPLCAYRVSRLPCVGLTTHGRYYSFRGLVCGLRLPAPGSPVRLHTFYGLPGYSVPQFILVNVTRFTRFVRCTMRSTVVAAPTFCHPLLPLPHLPAASVCYWFKLYLRSVDLHALHLPPDPPTPAYNQCLPCAIPHAYRLATVCLPFMMLPHLTTFAVRGPYAGGFRTTRWTRLCI